VIGKIFKSVFSNFQTFLVTWVVILILNQLFIFGGCFAPYCLIAALPHTGVIAAFVTYFIIKEEVRPDKEIARKIEESKKENLARHNTATAIKYGAEFIAKSAVSMGTKAKTQNEIDDARYDRVEIYAKRKIKQTNSSKILTYLAWSLAIIALVLGVLVGGYYMGYEEAKNDIKVQVDSEKKKDSYY